MTEQIHKWHEVTSVSMTNKYLKGKLTNQPLQEFFRSKASYDALGSDKYGKFDTIKVDMQGYMQHGAGRYAYPSKAAFVKDFFDPLCGI